MQYVISNKFEILLTDTGITYGVVFAGSIEDVPRQCEIFIEGHKIGQATWQADGLLDRCSVDEKRPPHFWEKLCDEVERYYSFMLRGHRSAQKAPWFTTPDGYLLEYNFCVWTDGDLEYSAANITGRPLCEDGTYLSGTYHKSKPSI